MRKRIVRFLSFIIAIAMMCSLAGCTRSGMQIRQSKMDPDAVVATCGSEILTAEIFEYFYWMEYERYVNDWGDVLTAEDSTASFDPYSSLAAQKRNTDDRTWQQYFIDQAMDTVHRYLALISASKKDAEYTIPEENLALIDNAVEGLERQTELGEFDSPEALLRNLFFETATVEGHRQYYTLYVEANSYYDYLRDSMDVSDEVVQQMFWENRDAYGAQGIESDDNTSMVAFRHILIRPDLDDGAETATQEAWDEAKASAHAVLDDFKQTDGSVSAFSQLAIVFSEDGNTYLKGGLYEHVYPGEYEDEMDAWLFDKSRQEGDMEVVRSSVGYHVMWYLGQEGLPYWYYRAAVDFATQRMEFQLSELLETYNLTRNDTGIVLNDLP